MGVGGVSASDVADKLLEAIDLEATRLLAAARLGPLKTGDRIGLTEYLKAVNNAAADEWRRLKELDPERFQTEQIDRLLGDGNSGTRRRKRIAPGSPV